MKEKSIKTEHIKLDVGPNVRAYSFPDMATAMNELRNVVVPDQQHTDKVGIATDASECFPSTDALITNAEGLHIGIRTADCVPILLNAPDIGAVAAIHAGWRGTLAGIVRKAIGKLMEMGADPTAIHAAMGPCICGECYEVGPELAKTFSDAGFGDCIITPKGEKEHLDLPAVNRKILLDCGLKPETIAMPPACTLESEDWPSWRREHGTDNRLLTLIARNLL